MKKISELINEWKTTDSIKRKEELHSVIDELVVPKFKYLYGIGDPSFERYNIDYEYQNHRGCLSFNDSYGGTVILEYSDIWGYGGECDFLIYVPIEDVEKWFEDGYDETARQNKLKHDIETKKQKIKELEETIERAKAEIEKLSAEINDTKVEQVNGRSEQ